MRVLVTGSRDWIDVHTMRKALCEWLCDPPNILIHGAARGADEMAADLVWQEWGDTVKIIAVSADWDAHGKAAGPMRNQQMVDLGADVCLGFPLPDSRGTIDCITRAIKAGIPVRTYAPLVTR